MVPSRFDGAGLAWEVKVSSKPMAQHTPNARGPVTMAQATF